MKKQILLAVIALLFTDFGSVASVSVAANTEEPSHGRSHNRYWTKESFTVNNRKGVIKDDADNLYATRIVLRIPPKESSKDVVSSDTESADQG